MESRHRRGVIVLLMDLNGFKAINDRLGHQCGDALLVAFADRLESGRPTDATAARLGGDEFALLVRDPDQTAHALVEDIHTRLTQPLTLEGFPLTTGVSIGVATAPHDGATTAEILQAADVAMYKAKRTETAFAFYDQCIKLPRHGRLNLLTDLSEALVNHQLHLEFQPQIRFNDGAVDTLEALVRWNHPVHGRIPPTEFIGLAEQTDLIGSITDLVLRTASGGMVAGELNTRLAVNIAPRSLEDPDFADRIFRTIAETGFSPDRLELELTERGLVRNVERSGYAIRKLRDAGVRIAIDDFGVGYSSYQTLRNIEVDRVKIDRDFVQGVLTSDRDRIIVSSLIELAHDLGLDVVAEGVESSLVWDALAALDCDLAQGFGIAVPMSYTDLRGWLAKWNNVALPGGRSDSLVK
jgi:diguanylate cyclase (GGDEF)-like protein